MISLEYRYDKLLVDDILGGQEFPSQLSISKREKREGTIMLNDHHNLAAINIYSLS